MIAGVNLTTEDNDCTAPGKIWRKEVVVTIEPGFWWDKVFEPGYKLRTFEELTLYVLQLKKENKELREMIETKGE